MFLQNEHTNTPRVIPFCFVMFCLKPISHIVLSEKTSWGQFTISVFISQFSFNLQLFIIVYIIVNYRYLAYLKSKEFLVPNFRKLCFDILAIISLDSKLSPRYK